MAAGRGTGRRSGAAAQRSATHLAVRPLPLSQQLRLTSAHPAATAPPARPRARPLRARSRVGEEAAGADGQGPAWLPQLQEEAWELAAERAPPASLMAVRDGDSMARWALARLEPLHNDPPLLQEAALPELAALEPAARAALSARFHPTDDPSLRQWAQRLRIALQPQRAGGLQARGGAGGGGAQAARTAADLPGHGFDGV